MASNGNQNGGYTWHYKKPRAKYVAPVRDPNIIALPDREDLPEEARKLLFTVKTLPKNGGGIETSRWAPRQASQVAVNARTRKTAVSKWNHAQPPAVQVKPKGTGLTSSNWATPQKAGSIHDNSPQSSKGSHFNPEAKEFHRAQPVRVDSPQSSSGSRFNPEAKAFQGSEPVRTGSPHSSQGSRFNPEAKEFHVGILSKSEEPEDSKSISSATRSSWSSGMSFDPRAKEFTVSTMSPPTDTKNSAVSSVVECISSSRDQLGSNSESKATSSNSGTPSKAQTRGKYVIPHQRDGYIPLNLRCVPAQTVKTVSLIKEVPAHKKPGYIPPHAWDEPAKQDAIVVPDKEQVDNVALLSDQVDNALKQAEPAKTVTLPTKQVAVVVQPLEQAITTQPCAKQTNVVALFVEEVAPPVEEGIELPLHRRPGYVPPHLWTEPIENVENKLPALEQVEDVIPTANLVGKVGLKVLAQTDNTPINIEHLHPQEDSELPAHRRPGYIPPHLWQAVDQVATEQSGPLELEKVDAELPDLKQIEEVLPTSDSASQISPKAAEQIDNTLPHTEETENVLPHIEQIKHVLPHTEQIEHMLTHMKKIEHALPHVGQVEDLTADSDQVSLDSSRILAQTDNSAAHLSTPPQSLEEDMGLPAHRRPGYVPPHLWGESIDQIENVLPHHEQAGNATPETLSRDEYNLLHPKVLATEKTETFSPQLGAASIDKVDVTLLLGTFATKLAVELPATLRTGPVRKTDNIAAQSRTLPTEKAEIIAPQLHAITKKRAENIASQIPTLTAEKVDYVAPHSWPGPLPPLPKSSITKTKVISDTEKIGSKPTPFQFELTSPLPDPGKTDIKDIINTENVDYMPLLLESSTKSTNAVSNIKKSGYVPPHAWPGPFPPVPESYTTGSEAVSSTVTPSITQAETSVLLSKVANIAKKPTATIPELLHYNKPSKELVFSSSEWNAKNANHPDVLKILENSRCSSSCGSGLNSKDGCHVSTQEQRGSINKPSLQVEAAAPKEIKIEDFDDTKLQSYISIIPEKLKSARTDSSRAKHNGLLAETQSVMPVVARFNVTSLTREALIKNDGAAPMDVISDGIDMAVSETGIECKNESAEDVINKHAPTPKKDSRNYLANPETHLRDWTGGWSPAPIDWEDDRPIFESGFVPEFISTWSNGLPPLSGQVDMTRDEFTSGLSAIICQGFAAPLGQPLTYPDVINSDDINKQRLQTADIDSKNFIRQLEKKKKVLKQATAACPPDDPDFLNAVEQAQNLRAPKMSIYLRPAEEKDVTGITEIYNHYVLNSIIPEDQAEITEAQMHNVFLDARDEKLPFIVAIRGPPPPNGRARYQEEVVGYARTEAQNYGLNGLHSGRSRFTGQTELYVHPAHLRQGIGRSLLDRLLVCSSYAHPSKEGYSWICPNPRDADVYGQQGGVRQFHQLLMTRSVETKNDPDLPWLSYWLYSKFYFNEVGRMKSCARSKTIGAPARFLDVVTFQFEAALEGEFGMYT